MDLAEELAREAEWAEASAQQGPHCLMQQPDMRLFWWRCFGLQEEVAWDVFWSRFPKDLNRHALSKACSIVMITALLDVLSGSMASCPTPCPVTMQGCGVV